MDPNSFPALAHQGPMATQNMLNSNEWDWPTYDEHPANVLDGDAAAVVLRVRALLPPLVLVPPPFLARLQLAFVLQSQHRLAQRLLQHMISLDGDSEGFARELRADLSREGGGERRVQRSKNQGNR